MDPEVRDYNYFLVSQSGPGEYGLDGTGDERYERSPRTSDALLSFVESIQDVKRRLRGTMVGERPGRTADVKEVALFRLQQAADAMAAEAVVLERTGE